MAAKKKRPKKGAPPTSRAPAPDPSTQASRLVRTLLVVALLVFGAASALVFVWYPDTEGPGMGQSLQIDFRGDESPAEVTSRLEAARAVRDPRLFAFYFRLKGGTVKKGRHLLTDALTPRELVARLARDGARVKVVVPEGWTRFDMARRFEKLGVCDVRAFLDATRDPALLAELHVDAPTAEGFLFPATYELAANSEAPDVVRRLVHEFDKRWAALEKEHAGAVRDLASGSLHLGRKEIVTLASLVEKEAAVDDERPLIAAVFLNRLRDPSFTPRLLQSDPTAGYGCLVSEALSCLGYAGKITHEIVADATNPYNTYKHEGLPPGPIASPGERSIAAVLTPSATPFLYFVAKGQGRHTFSETYAQHQEAIRAIHGSPQP
jgi:UPF0755 protein